MTTRLRPAITALVFAVAFPSVGLAGNELRPLAPGGGADYVADVSPSLSTPALALINELASANRRSFFVYRDADSGFNHGSASGLFPAGVTPEKLSIDAACIYDAPALGDCATDPHRIDPERGTVMRLRFGPLSRGEFAGVNFEEPEHFGANKRGVGYDLRGATRVCFDALSPSPQLRVQFGVAGRLSAFTSLPTRWTSRCLELGSLGVKDSDLAQVHLLFTVVSNDRNAPEGGVLLLDNIRFDPAPVRQRTVPALPQANRVFGVVPAVRPLGGRVPTPPDQVLANTATTYESALAVLALLSRGSAEDLESAQAIADALVHALSRDNGGLPLPRAPDGSSGVRDAYSSGDLPLLNDQGPGAGRAGQVRLAGFSLASGDCGPSHYCLVLDGATGGNNAFAILALAAAYERLRDRRYLDAARTIGNWIHGNLSDSRGTGFGGYFLGYPDEGRPKRLLRSKSVENNADIFAAFARLGSLTGGIGRGAEAAEWERRARYAGDFVMRMFDPGAGRFFAGTVPVGTAHAAGIRPDGQRQGDEVINTFDFLDAQTFSVLVLAGSPQYRNAIDWRRTIQWAAERFAVQVHAGDQVFRGFSLVSAPSAGPHGIAWEFTAQMVVAMRHVDRMYGQAHFGPATQDYLEHLKRAERSAPFADGRGLVAATVQDGQRLPPHAQCLSTPFQCIAQRVGIAATAWAVFAESGDNPLQGGRLR